uniref:Uncharacterized protein n=1 Tax=Nelumbo nucifera TaxID=4432 RepID=A0A822XLH5_NELNU|nr:TPA_asm: hypothetical protein HUJ06_021383 [Nelumbo nucifera]
MAILAAFFISFTYFLTLSPSSPPINSFTIFSIISESTKPRTDEPLFARTLRPTPISSTTILEFKYWSAIIAQARIGTDAHTLQHRVPTIVTHEPIYALVLQYLPLVHLLLYN